VDRHFVTVAALTELAAEGTIPVGTASQAIAKYGLNPDKPNPARA
jgi:pyruvate dehydrogenase E1 component